MPSRRHLPDRTRPWRFNLCVWTALFGIAGSLAVGVGEIRSADDSTREHDATTGRSLYEKHCAGCHGQNGSGDGPGVRYVYPLPRNLRRDRYNLVSNSSRVASRDDIARVLDHGMPGTSMKPYRDVLKKAELAAIVDEVLRLRREGALEAYRDRCRTVDELPDEEEARTFVERQTTAAPPLPAPEFGHGGRSAVARGRQLFRRQGCPSCHGLDGSGAADLMLKDQAGTPLRPRDLVREYFKGGHDDMAVYYRIRFGFPGGPMPEHPGLTEEEMVDLVAYVQSLSREPKRRLRTYEMRRYATRGLYVSELGGSSKTGP